MKTENYDKFRLAYCYHWLQIFTSVAYFNDEKYKKEFDLWESVAQSFKESNKQKMINWENYYFTYKDEIEYDAMNFLAPIKDIKNNLFTINNSVDRERYVLDILNDFKPFYNLIQCIERMGQDDCEIARDAINGFYKVDISEEDEIPALTFLSQSYHDGYLAFIKLLDAECLKWGIDLFALQEKHHIKIADSRDESGLKYALGGEEAYNVLMNIPIIAIPKVISNAENIYNRLIDNEYIEADIDIFLKMCKGEEMLKKDQHIKWIKQPKQKQATVKRYSGGALVDMLSLLFGLQPDPRSEDRNKATNIAKTYFDITLNSQDFQNAETKFYEELKDIIKADY